MHTDFSGMLNGWCGIYMGTVVRTGILGYLRKAHKRTSKFPEGKERLLINMSDTREIEHTQDPNTKCYQICGNTFIYVSERQTAELMLMSTVQFHCQTCRRHLKHVKAYEVPPSLTVAWVTSGEQMEG